MAIGFDDLERRPGFFVTSKPERVPFLPEPERRARWCTLISVDDHLVEPPHLFESRLPARLQPYAPRVEVDDDGMEYWAYDGRRHYKVGLDAMVGRPREELSFEPTRFDEMRRGAWDIDARVHDMDLNGVYASLNFPSSLAGFAGQRYQLECVAAGGAEILEDEVVAGKAMYRKHFLPQMWDADLARLRRSDPDLFCA